MHLRSHRPSLTCSAVCLLLATCLLPSLARHSASSSSELLHRPASINHSNAAAGTHWKLQQGAARHLLQHALSAPLPDPALPQRAEAVHDKPQEQQQQEPQQEAWLDGDLLQFHQEHQHQQRQDQDLLQEQRLATHGQQISGHFMKNQAASAGNSSSSAAAGMATQQAMGWNVSGMYRGTWSAKAFDPRVTGSAVLHQRKGVLLYNLKTSASSAKGVLVVRGRMILRDGAHSIDHDIAFELEGYYVMASGALHAVLQPALVSPNHAALQPTVRPLQPLQLMDGLAAVSVARTPSVRVPEWGHGATTVAAGGGGSGTQAMAASGNSSNAAKAAVAAQIAAQAQALATARFKAAHADIQKASKLDTGRSFGGGSSSALKAVLGTHTASTQDAATAMRDAEWVVSGSESDPLGELGVAQSRQGDGNVMAATALNHYGAALRKAAERWLTSGATHFAATAPGGLPKPPALLMQAECEFRLELRAQLDDKGLLRLHTTRAAAENTEHNGGGSAAAVVEPGAWSARRQLSSWAAATVAPLLMTTGAHKDATQPAKHCLHARSRVQATAEACLQEESALSTGGSRHLASRPLRDVTAAGSSWTDHIATELNEFGTDSSNSSSSGGRADNSDGAGSVRHDSGSGNYGSENYDQHPDLQLNGLLFSPNCNISLELNSTSMQLARFVAKAESYSLFVTVTTVLQLALLARQAMHTSQSISASAKVSMLCIGHQAVLDAYLCLAHLTTALTSEALFMPMASVALTEFMLFAVLAMRYLLAVWRAQRPASASLSPQQEMAAIYVRFYAALLAGVFVAYQLQEHVGLLLLLLHSFWLPQIVHSALSETRPPLLPAYVIGSSVSRLLLPAYFLGCPSNLLWQPVRFGALGALVAWVALQAALLGLQGRYGSRCFIPRRLLPRQYDFHREATARELGGHDGPADVETGLATRECVICMQPVPISPGSERMLTPCSHWFHTACLSRWMANSPTCPTCRSQLPLVSSE